MNAVRIPLKGKYGKGRLAIVDGDYDGEYFSGLSWYISPNGYVVRKKFAYEGRNGVVYLHREVSRTPKGMFTDHINRNKLDNRSCNLRWVTPKENSANRPQAKHKKVRKSGYRGVVKHPHAKTWRAMCNRQYLGSRKTPEEAAKLYDRVAYDLWKDDAVLNFPIANQLS